MASPFLAITLDVKSRVDLVARAAQTTPGAALWSVLCLWETALVVPHVTTTGKLPVDRTRISALFLRGCLGPDPRLREALGAFGFLELHDDGGATVCNLGQHGTPPRPVQRGSDPLVYFVRVGGEGPIKIGFTSNLASRLRGLQVAHTGAVTVLATISDADPRRVEKALHQRFAHLRVAREWFRADPELLEYIRGLT